MSAFVPQQPNVPPMGPYRNPTTPRLFGTTNDDIRRIKKEASEEDYSQFLLSDSVYTDYRKTNDEIVYFENLQSGDPNYLKLKLPESAYPHRCDSAYFHFQFDLTVTLPKYVPNVVEEGEPDPPLDLTEVTPTFFKIWKLIESYKITVGSNECVITNSEQSYHYQNRVMSLITKPISQSNKMQEYVGADIFLDYLLLDDFRTDARGETQMINLLWRLYKMDPTKVKQGPSDIQLRIPINFVIPLTMLHPLYNVNSVIPPGMKTSFEFKLRNLRQVTKYVFRLTDTAREAKFGVRLRTAPTKCFLRIERPERFPEILRSLKLKAYYNDFIYETFHRIDFEVGPGNSVVDKLVIIPQGNDVPVRIDWILTSKNLDEESPFFFADESVSILKEVKYLIHNPFPYERTVKYTNSVTEERVVDLPQDAAPFGPPALSDANFHSEDNFIYATFGNQHVKHGLFPQVAKSFNRSEYLAFAHVNKRDPDLYVKSMAFDQAKRYFYPNSFLLLPSDQLNQNPYPRLRGAVYMSFVFKEPMEIKKTFHLFVNTYDYYRIHQENGKCSFLPIDDLGVSLDQADRP